MKYVFGDCGVRTKSHPVEPHHCMLCFLYSVQAILCFNCQFGIPTVRYMRSGAWRRAEGAIPPMPSFPADSAHPEQGGT